MTGAGASCSGRRGGAGRPAAAWVQTLPSLIRERFQSPGDFFHGWWPPSPSPQRAQGQPLSWEPVGAWSPHSPCRPSCRGPLSGPAHLPDPVSPAARGVLPGDAGLGAWWGPWPQRVREQGWGGRGGTGRDGGPWQTVSDRATNHSLLCGQRLVTQGHTRCWPMDHCSVRATRPALGGEASLAGQRHPPNKNQGKKPGPLRQGGLTGHS